MAIRSFGVTAGLALVTGALGQQVGTNTAENHPPMPIDICSSSGCSSQDTSIVLDANWRWVHNVGGYTNCYSGNAWNSQYCTNGTTCAEDCALEGADYSGTYGINTNDGALTLTLVTGNNVGSRTYLLNAAGTEYQMFMLKNREFTFEVDVSNLPCGLNGALYFTAMDADGGMSRSPNNKAGAPYGTGYCDAQCPQDIKFVNGVANCAGWTPASGDPNSGTGNMGACCTEMDIWEANSVSNAVTPHPCSGDGINVCASETSCGSGDDRYDGFCDKDGCDFNPYRWGATGFYGAGDTVDTTKPFTVVTQFITADGTDTGDLSAIRRLYVQNGNVIQNSETNLSGVDTTNEISDNFCTQQKSVTGNPDQFAAKGGMTGMGQQMENGMVLVMSVWDDWSAHMLWLDSTYPTGSSGPGAARGTCSESSGNPPDVQSSSPGASVTFSNIKFGTIGSTY